MIPPYVFDHAATHGTADQKVYAREQLKLSRRLRAQRELRRAAGLIAGEHTPGIKTRRTYDAQGTEQQPTTPARNEGDGPDPDDVEVNEAHEAMGALHDFYRTVLGRDSIDDRGLVLRSYVDWDTMDNAYWDGEAGTYGRGQWFKRFTIDVTIPGHEVGGHGYIHDVWDPPYQGDPGTLDESGADVMGSLLEQWLGQETTTVASWYIGRGLLDPSPQWTALRDMLLRAPAYKDHPVFGTDPQSQYRTYATRYRGTQDNGGVHINSGIPNKAYATAAVRLGGYAWEHVGLLWLRDAMPGASPTLTIPGWAARTYTLAKSRWSPDVVEAVREGWASVEIDVEAPEPAPDPVPSDCPPEIRAAIIRLAGSADAQKLMTWGRRLARH